MYRSEQTTRSTFKVIDPIRMGSAIRLVNNEAYSDEASRSSISSCNRPRLAYSVDASKTRVMAGFELDGRNEPHT